MRSGCWINVPFRVSYKQKGKSLVIRLNVFHHFPDSNFERANFIFINAPQYLAVYFVASVAQGVSKVCDLAPGNVILRLLHIYIQVAGGFADDFQKSFERRSGHRVIERGNRLVIKKLADVRNVFGNVIEPV